MASLMPRIANGKNGANKASAPLEMEHSLKKFSLLTFPFLHQLSRFLTMSPQYQFCSRVLDPLLLMSVPFRTLKDPSKEVHLLERIKMKNFSINIFAYIKRWEVRRSYFRIEMSFSNELSLCFLLNLEHLSMV